MATIFRHPEVEDYFVEWDARSDAPDDVCRHYEDGKVVVMKNLLVDHDAQFLASLAMPNDPELKKFKSAAFLNEFGSFRLRDWLKSPLTSLSGNARSPVIRVLRDKVFGGDKGRLEYFVEQMRKIHRQIEDLTARLFPNYRIVQPRITWRFQDTVHENLHVDVYRDDLPDHHLRIFANLDIVPRIWHTSYTLEYLLRNYLGRLNRDFVRRATPGRICHDLNFEVFKGWEAAGREGCPKHIIFFQPGEIWAVDSRKVSHQIFYGRRALSTDHAVARNSMRSPETHYYELVERYRAECLAARLA
jgi:hypothetical protein